MKTTVKQLRLLIREALDDKLIDDDGAYNFKNFMTSPTTRAYDKAVLAAWKVFEQAERESHAKNKAAYDKTHEELTTVYERERRNEYAMGDL